MRVYIAGPMTGIPQFNYPAFMEAAEYLRSRAYDVQSPAEMDDPATAAAALQSPDGAPGSGSANGETWGDFLARDVKLLADGDERGPIDAVFVLPGWEKSRGARLETFVAAAMCGKPIYCLQCYHDGSDLEATRVPPYALEAAWAGRQPEMMGAHQ